MVRGQIFRVDAFATRRFTGNPAAVVVLRRFPDHAFMQAVAGENNLAETAFVVGHRYRMRWFTPIVEVKLCGHATLAAGAVVLEPLHFGREGVVFDTTSGPLSVHRRGRAYEVDLPARTVSTVSTPVELSAALGLVPLETATDAGNYIARLRTAQDVRDLEPDLSAVARLDKAGVVVTASAMGRTTS